MHKFRQSHLVFISLKKVRSKPLFYLTPALNQKSGFSPLKIKKITFYDKAEPHVSNLKSDETSDGDSNEVQRRATKISQCSSVFGFLENIVHRLSPLLPSLLCGLPPLATDRGTAKRVAVACLVSRQIAYM
ncbi:MAG: hypothetical protein O7C56_05520, partial [Rickettsia endosymbiont of Ixodes persulcatus]|nr:hypothetical protein [Rickettsia endosymbiont of Ixodes persulcatus]